MEYDNEEYIIANLDSKHLNEPLDLGFTKGEKIAFKVCIIINLKIMYATVLTVCPRSSDPISIVTYYKNGSLLLGQMV